MSGEVCNRAKVPNVSGAHFTHALTHTHCHTLPHTHTTHTLKRTQVVRELDEVLRGKEPTLDDLKQLPYVELGAKIHTCLCALSNSHNTRTRKHACIHTHARQLQKSQTHTP